MVGADKDDMSPRGVLSLLYVTMEPLTSQEMSFHVCVKGTQNQLIEHEWIPEKDKAVSSHVVILKEKKSYWYRGSWYVQFTWKH